MDHALWVSADWHEGGGMSAAYKWMLSQGGEDEMERAKPPLGKPVETVDEQLKDEARNLTGRGIESLTMERWLGKI